jgi:hypothetical protein
VQGSPTLPEADLARRREVIDAFLAAAREGNFDPLLAVLDPDVVLTPLAGGWRRGYRSVRLRAGTSGRWGVRYSACWSRRLATVVASRWASHPTAPGVRIR